MKLTSFAITVLAGATVSHAHNHENVLASTHLRGGGGRNDNAIDNIVTSSQERLMEEGNDSNNDAVQISNRRQTEGKKLKPTWEPCTLSNQCETGCCASRYSTDGKLKCTPLEGAFRPDICVTHHTPTVHTTSVKSISSGTCGGGSRGDGICADGTCCSEIGWCGVTPEHCAAKGGGNGGGSTSSITPRSTGTCGGGNRGDGICPDGTCCSEFGWCGITPEHCAASGGGSSGGSTSSTPPPSTGTCGGGHRGNGICADGTCCSQFGWCGVTPEHCAAATGTDGGTGGTPPATWTVTSPAIALTAAQIHVGINAKGDSVSVSQKIVEIINKVTKDLSLYQQLAFVAHTIWESGSYQYREELDTSKYGLYQDCDWNQEGVQLPTNDKLFYGRGYLQLSWCANYKAYGAARMYQGDPDLFYNQPELVATDDFIAMDSAIWFFESRVTDTTGQFGLTTNAINGQIECSGSSDLAKKRYEIFVALANAVGMSGYSESGCYN